MRAQRWRRALFVLVLLDLALTVLLYLLVPPPDLCLCLSLVSPPVSSSHSGRPGCLTSALRQAAGNCGDSSRRGFVCWARLPKLFLETALRSVERDLREFNFSLALVCHTLSPEKRAPRRGMQMHPWPPLVPGARMPLVFEQHATRNTQR